MTTELLDTREVTDDEVFEAIKARLRVGWTQGANGTWGRTSRHTKPRGEVCLYGAYLAVCNRDGDSYLPVTPTQRSRIWSCLDREGQRSGGNSGINFNDQVATRVEQVIDLVARAKAACRA